jgi:hypothetical protein
MREIKFDWKDFFRPTWGKTLLYIFYVGLLSNILTFVYMRYASNFFYNHLLSSYIIPIYAGPFSLLASLVPWMTYVNVLQGSLFVQVIYLVFNSVVDLMTLLYKYFVVCLLVFAYRKYINRSK